VTRPDGGETPRHALEPADPRRHQDADRARSKEAGCDGHLVKPVDLLELEKLLAGLDAGP
jgi:CheY-like chemotaxis protein